MALHVVFGAGQVGSGLARVLVARGHRVRVVRRGTGAVPGAEVVSGDAQDPAFAARVCEGAAVIYHCMNPSAYTVAAWEAEFPRLGEALIGAAVASGARLVCLDNLYGYGIVDGRRTERTPFGATGPKARVRIAWDARLRAEPTLRFVVARAGDFFGPGAGDASLFSHKALRSLAAGSSTWLIGDADAPHAFSYVPDVVAGLAALGEADGVDRDVFHLPVLEVAPRALVTHLATALGSRAGARSLPAWLVSWLGVVVPLFANLRETLYQWDRPFLADDARFRARFPGLASSLDGAVAGTVADVRASVA